MNNSFYDNEKGRYVSPLEIVKDYIEEQHRSNEEDGDVADMIEFMTSLIYETFNDRDLW